MYVKEEETQEEDLHSVQFPRKGFTPGARWSRKKKRGLNVDPRYVHEYVHSWTLAAYGRRAEAGGDSDWPVYCLPNL